MSQNRILLFYMILQFYGYHKDQICYVYVLYHYTFATFHMIYILLLLYLLRIFYYLILHQ